MKGMTNPMKTWNVIANIWPLGTASGDARNGIDCVFLPTFSVISSTAEFAISTAKAVINPFKEQYLLQILVRSGFEVKEWSNF